MCHSWSTSEYACRVAANIDLISVLFLSVQYIYTSLTTHICINSKKKSYIDYWMKINYRKKKNPVKNWNIIIILYLTCATFGFNYYWSQTGHGYIKDDWGNYCRPPLWESKANMRSIVTATMLVISYWLVPLCCSCQYQCLLWQPQSCTIVWSQSQQPGK